jgi:hypothetical protein
MNIIAELLTDFSLEIDKKIFFPLAHQNGYVIW